MRAAQIEAVENVLCAISAQVGELQDVSESVGQSDLPLAHHFARAVDHLDDALLRLQEIIALGRE